MRALSLRTTVDMHRLNAVYELIQKNKYFFIKYNPHNYEEAMEEALKHVMKKGKGDDLEPYVRSLAKTIMKNKVFRNEIPYQVTNGETGEEDAVFRPISTLWEHDSVHQQDLKNRLVDLYFLYPDDFMLFMNAFRSLSTAEEAKATNVRAMRKLKIKGEIFSLAREYSAPLLYVAMQEIYKDMCSKDKGVKAEEPKVLEISLKPADYSCWNRVIPGEGFIPKKTGERVFVEKDSYLSAVNPDCVEWCFPVDTKKNIYKIDISMVMNYAYDFMLVKQGVDTDFVTWLDGRCRLCSLGGYSVINTDLQKFLDLQFKELILNIVASGITKIVAISPDFLYFTARQKIADSVTFRVSNGKSFKSDVLTVKEF